MPLTSSLISNGKGEEEAATEYVSNHAVVDVITTTTIHRISINISIIFKFTFRLLAMCWSCFVASVCSGFRALCLLLRTMASPVTEEAVYKSYVEVYAFPSAHLIRQGCSLPISLG